MSAQPNQVQQKVSEKNLSERTVSERKVSIRPEKGVTQNMMYSGALTDGGDEYRRREQTINPVHATNRVEEAKRRVRESFPLLTEGEVESLVLRAMYGYMKAGQA